MQRNGGLSRTRNSLHHKVALERIAYDVILLRLYCGYDLLQSVACGLGKGFVQVFILRHDVRIEYGHKFALIHAELTLQRELAFHIAVGGGIFQRAYLSGIIEVCNGCAPVHHLRFKVFRAQHAVLADVISTGHITLFGEVYPREIRLVLRRGKIFQRLYRMSVQHFAHGQRVGFESACMVESLFGFFHFGLSRIPFRIYHRMGLFKVFKFFPVRGMFDHGHCAAPPVSYKVG